MQRRSLFTYNQFVYVINRYYYITTGSKLYQFFSGPVYISSMFTFPFVSWDGPEQVNGCVGISGRGKGYPRRDVGNTVDLGTCLQCVTLQTYRVKSAAPPTVKYRHCVDPSTASLSKTHLTNLRGLKYWRLHGDLFEHPWVYILEFLFIFERHLKFVFLYRN